MFTNVQKYATLAFTALGFAAGTFANVSNFHDTHLLLVAAATVLMGWAGLCITPPWHNAVAAANAPAVAVVEPVHVPATFAHV